MKIEFVEEIDSTNAELMRRAARGEYEEVCLCAKRQSAGRGRLGRHWASEHQALMFSLGMVLKPKEWLGLSLVVGLSIAQSLHECVKVKWPNDLLVGDKKLAGILIETTAVQGATDGSRYVVMGVGINLDAPPSRDFARPAAALRDLIPQLTPDQALALLLNPLVASVKTFEQQGYKPYQLSFAARDALQGKPIALSSGIAGKAAGTDSDGALLIQTEAGLERVISHEVTTQGLGDHPSSSG